MFSSSFLPFTFFPSLSLLAIFSITLFFLPFFLPYFAPLFSFFFFVLFYCLLPLSPCLPSFLFSFSYSFPIPFLPPHSLSSSFFSCFHFSSLFPPLLLRFFLSFLPLFYSPDFFLLFPSSLSRCFCLCFSLLPLNLFFSLSCFTSLPRGLL